VERRNPRRAQRPSALFDVGDHDSADAASGFPPGARQTGGLIVFLFRLLGLDLAALDHSTISRRGETMRLQAFAVHQQMHWLAAQSWSRRHLDGVSCHGMS
jgi:hypothetical protein